MSEEEEEPTIGTRQRALAVKKPHSLKSPPLKLVEKKKEEKMKTSSATSKVRFVGWRNPPKHWDSWVKKLSSLHQSTWKNAGIYEAIMSSMYAIKRHDDLILELASRWCSETNTFVFPWGEATLTLEDMLVLGGFSALGISALSSLENDAKLLKIKESLELERAELVRSRAQKAHQGKWIEKFKDCGSELEHAAFLSLWLSRFVFCAGSRNTINKHVFPIAARLSRGIKIALGPAVLAMLYKDLTAFTKRRRFMQLVGQLGDSNGHLDLCAPFQLVQIWAWERFPLLKPVPNSMYSGKNFPRSARWSNLKILKEKDLRSAIDSAGKSFLWCPYGALSEREGRDPESFGRCVKTSELTELVGFVSCIESYQPQRVARQFGFDQDILSDNVDKATQAPFQPTLYACEEKWKKQQMYLTSSQVKVENDVDCDPPGFPARIEVIDVVDSDSDSDHDWNLMMTEPTKHWLMMTEPTKLHVPAPDVADDTCCVDDTEESERGEKRQTFPLMSAQNKREDKGKVETKHDEIEGRSIAYLQNELAMSCDAESYTHERSKDFDSDFDLEARISRLEDIVYAHIKALEAGK